MFVCLLFNLFFLFSRARIRSTEEEKGNSTLKIIIDAYGFHSVALLLFITVLSPVFLFTIHQGWGGTVQETGVVNLFRMKIEKRNAKCTRVHVLVRSISFSTSCVHLLSQLCFNFRVNRFLAKTRVRWYRPVALLRRTMKSLNLIRDFGGEIKFH